eukprot:TRINITY_DN4783_c0_g1_i1.p1 TRINITY_DN4783_c0_g1~~TRINITY_DN4783_c0_g1_i1.p1  ORF type:complete len:393 (+),score=97.40 TRINITY_DN4783_c0_g1_i1:176-1180(+)
MLDYIRVSCNIDATEEELADNLRCLFQQHEAEPLDSIALGDVGETERRGATKYSIVRCITDGVCMTDSTALFISTVLLTFRMYWTPREMLAMLIFRFFEPMPQKYMKIDEMEAYEREHVQPRTSSVITVLVSWIDQLFLQDFQTEWMLDTLFNFIELSLAGSFQEQAEGRRALKRALVKHIFSSEVRRLREHKKRKRRRKIPKPFLPSKTGELSVLDIHPTEVARQLTLIEWDMFKKTQPIEFLDQRWLQEPKKDNAPGIISTIEHFNRTSFWVASAVRDPPIYFLAPFLSMPPPRLICRLVFPFSIQLPAPPTSIKHICSQHCPSTQGGPSYT